MTPTIYEVLTEISKSDDQAATLAQYENDSIFIKFLRIALGVDYKFSTDLGEGFPSFVRINRDFPDGISDTTLRSEHRGFYLYQDDKELTAKKRLQLFGGMLEGLHYTEADLIVAIKDGKFYDMFPNVTYALVSNVFPQYFPRMAWMDDELVNERVTNLIDHVTINPVPDSVKTRTIVASYDTNITSQEMETCALEIHPEDVTIPETIKTTSEPVSTEVDRQVADTPKETIVEPVKVDKRSKAYRESIGRKK